MLDGVGISFEDAATLAGGTIPIGGSACSVNNVDGEFHEKPSGLLWSQYAILSESCRMAIFCNWRNQHQCVLIHVPYIRVLRYGFDENGPVEGV